MKRVFRTLVMLTALGIVGAAAVVGFGLYNVSARVGHFPKVSWILHTTYNQSVRLRAPAAEAIPKDINEWDRIKLGALHFQGACAFCHSLPGQLRSATAMSMTPRPPHITEATSNWEPQHMFWIVKNGVKMSGMPHWPAAERPDEVWSVVAYLNAVPEMTAQNQTELIGDTPGSAKCTACHGPKGRSENSYVPRLDILTSDQITEALTQYRAGTRPSGIMREVTRDMSDVQIAEVATHFGSALTVLPVTRMPSTLTDAGAFLARRGTADVSACTVCHGPGREANAPIAPVLAGQSRDYLEIQLKLWREGLRGGGTRANLMVKAAQDLDDDQIAALADWFAELER